MVRIGLRRLLEGRDHIEICCESAEAGDAWTKISANPPDLVILDMLLASGSTLDLIRRIREADLPTRILVYSMHDEALYGERAFRAGADGFVNKEQPPPVFLKAIEAILAGSRSFSSSTLERVRQSAEMQSEPVRDAVASFTDRELEVFELMGRGLSTQQIADHLAISPKTVESHRIKLKEKLGGIGLIDLYRRAALWVVGDPPRT